MRGRSNIQIMLYVVLILAPKLFAYCALPC